MKEASTERKLVAAAKALGALALKVDCRGSAGWPDRVILYPDSHIRFIELKAPGRAPRPLQLERHRQLRQLGFTVLIVDHSTSIPDALAR